MMERTEFYLQTPSPYSAVDKALLIQNLELLAMVRECIGCRILLAQKASSMFSLHPLIRKCLSGATVNGLYEARLGFEEMDKGNYMFSPTCRDEGFDEITHICDHIVFNPFSQWQKFGDHTLAAGRKYDTRISPECSTQNHAIHDPCSLDSWLGVMAANLHPELLESISGLHFHTLYGQGADALERALDAVEEKFGAYLPRTKWLNFGGGYHISRPDYDAEKLVSPIDRTQQHYGMRVYLESGGVVALNAGFLACTVLEIAEDDIASTILDTSAACHIPDVLEMPYRPPLPGVGLPEEKPHYYHLGGLTCLVGDIIGGYSFDHPLAPGDQLIFSDIAHYSMVKTNTFDGMTLLSIVVLSQSGKLWVQKVFKYEDFKGRLP